MTVIISLICRETVSAALKREKKREKCFNNKTVTQWNNERADRHNNTELLGCENQ